MKFLFPELDLSGYTWRWWLNLGLWVLTFLSVVQNVIMQLGIDGAWLGLSPVAWHWVLLVLAVAAGLNTLLNRTPLVTQPPTQNRLQVENKVAEVRKNG